jgi:hypothetical protein
MMRNAKKITDLAKYYFPLGEVNGDLIKCFSGFVANLVMPLVVINYMLSKLCVLYSAFSVKLFVR